jgi:hypothetical protein
MATALYDLARAAFAGGAINWAGATPVKAVLVDGGVYGVDLVNHDMLDDVPVGARIATATVGGRVIDGAGVCDADDVAFVAVTGAQVNAVVLYVDTGVPSTSRLIAYIDNFTGFPFTPSGGDVTLRWSDGANRIFKL